MKQTFRIRKASKKAILLITVLLTTIITIAAVTAIQNQNANPLICQTLLTSTNSHANQPIIVKADPAWEDETFTNTSTYSNMEIILNGNLTIDTGGILTLTNVTLRVNCTTNGEHQIEVKNNGTLYINGSSIITALNTSYRFLFKVQSGSTFQMNNSELHYCGYENTFSSNDCYGLWINTNNTIIINNTFTDGFYGIILWYSQNNTIINNTAINNDLEGFTLWDSQYNNLTGNYASNNIFTGFSLSYSSYNNLTGNTVINPPCSMLLLQASTCNIALTTILLVTPLQTPPGMAST